MLLRFIRSAAGRILRRAIWSVKRPAVERRMACVPKPPAVATGEGVILFYAPEAGITPHFAAQCVVARSLRERGHRVLFARCFELFPRCEVMDLVELPYDATQARIHDTCLRCVSASIRMLDEYSLEHVDLRALADTELLERVRIAMQSVPSDLREFVFDGIPFGRYCAVDLVLNTKIAQLERVDDGTRALWVRYIESGVRSYLLTEQLCRRLPVRHLVHCEDFSLLMCARLAAAGLGIPETTMLLAAHRDIDRGRYVFAPRGVSALVRECVDTWEHWRSLALSADQVRDVMDDLFTRFKGKASHIFSPARDVRQTDIRRRLHVPPGKRIIAAFTSSLDETLAELLANGGFEPERPLPPQPFADQVEWLRALMTFVAARDDLYLVVRVHPREGANVGGRASEHLQRLRERFGQPVPSCHFVWPDDSLSSYDIAEAANLVTISLSTIGVECARMGAPVLAATNDIGVFPADDFVECVSDRSAYFDRLQALIDRPASLDIISRAFRWYHLAHLGAAADMRDIITSSTNDWLPQFKSPRAAAAIEQALVGDTSMLQTNLAVQRRNQHPTSHTDEQAAIRMQLRRLIHHMCTAASSDGNFELVYGKPVAGDRATASHWIWSDDGTVHYTVGDRTFTRYSPLCARIAPVAASAAPAKITRRP